MMGEPHWAKDNFLNDFLFDTDQVEGEPEDAASWEGSDLDLMPADDASLSSYLSGEVFNGRGDGRRVSNNSIKRQTVSPEPVSLSEDDEGGNAHSVSHSQRSVIVVTRPPSRKGNSSSRQAIAARENRQKKKQYLSDLEASVKKFSEQNEQLKKQDAKQKQQIAELKEEVMYLKSVIANESALSALLKNIQNTNGVKLSASLLAKTDENSQLGVTKPAPGQKRKLPSCRMEEGNSEVTSSQDFPAKCSRPISSKPSSFPGRQHQQLQKMSWNSNSVSDTQTKGHSLAEPIVSVSSELTAPIVRTSQDGKTNEAVQAEADVDVGIFRKNVDLGGICLHVLGDSVSVEFCSSCNHSAMKSSSTDHAYVKVRE